MQRKRKGLTQGVNISGVNGAGVNKYPALLYALVDPDKRRRLERIHQSLKERGLTGMVTYGYGGPSFTEVGELLEATG